MLFMRKKVEISDRFDSASETTWQETNWYLEPYTRDIKKLLLPAALMIAIGGLGYAQYTFSSYDLWKNKMQSLYDPYNDAVAELQKLEYCEQPQCIQLEVSLEQQKMKAWKSLCQAERSAEYIHLLKQNDKPYQPCD